MSTKEIQDTRKNCSTIFLLPGIGLYRKDIVKYGFLSAYIDDINHPIHYVDSVYLLYKYDNHAMFQAFLDNERERAVNLILEDYDYEGGYTVVVYKFPEKFMPEYNNFLIGKYSSFRNEYKNIFPVSVEVMNDKGVKEKWMSLQHHVFGRTDTIKSFWDEKLGITLTEDMECWSAPSIAEKETLNINDL